MVAAVLANSQKQQKNHKAQSWLCLPNTLPLSSPLLPPQGQNNTIKCPITPFWWARDTEPGREREAGLRVWQLLGRFGGLCASVRARPDPDVLLGNSSRRLNSRRKKKQKEKDERERERETSPDALSFCFRRGVFLSVISPDWFLSRRACKHGYQREEGRAERADASVVYVGLKIAFPFSNWIYICLWEGNA